MKLTDFGLSRFSSIYSSVISATSTTTIMETVVTCTAAPEILENSNPVTYTGKSDMYSIGMLMIENNCTHNPINYNPTIIVEFSIPIQPSPSRASSFQTNINPTILPYDSFASLSSFGETDDHQQDLCTSSVLLIIQTGERSAVVCSTYFPTITVQTKERPKSKVKQTSNVSVALTNLTTNTIDGQPPQVRQVSSFYGIKTSGIFNIILTMGTTKPESVMLVSDQAKSLEKIETSVTLGILYIHSSSLISTRHQHISTSTHTCSISNHRGKGKTDVYINIHRLRSLKTSRMESVEISASSINVDIFDLECSGFNSIYGTNIIKLTVDGSSKFHGFDLRTKIAHIIIHSNCYGEINYNQTTTAYISNDNDGEAIKYKDNPSIIRSLDSTGEAIQKID
ncbi:unnamed protein product [Rotaria sordida]|uniref:Putative auto-transporter adhesin head GIN domain-containing protein n=1 Tax=Rotaria sordida TaxID=392033 RepID=A0A818MFT3_9BILA|nr:unnamed protein product [Rotaria sordida]